MATRREFVGAACAALAAPMILTLPARAAPSRIRRDVMDLNDSDPFFSKYADAVRAMHQLPESDGRNWRRQARIHADFCRHSQIPFLHWHRHYIAFFESICAELIGDSDFALPYWNWSKKNGVIPAAFFDLDALNVEFWNDPGIYSSTNWGSVDTVGKRGLAKGQGLLADTQRGGEFTASNIESIKRLPNIQLFEGRLEGSPHNNGHVVSGATSTGKTGHIGDGLSPLDPIFWLHHCMVDRVWAEWQRAGNASPDPGETYADNFFDKSGASKTVTAGGALDTGTLGYTYDVIEASAQPTGESGTQFVEITPNIEKALRDSAETVTLGSAENKLVSEAFVVTSIEVPVPGLLGAMEGSRAFRGLTQKGLPAVAVEPRRVLARFARTMPLENRNDLVVNVFVDNPDLTASTPPSDRHHAGSFSFFGGSHHHQEGTDFLVDITDPVRDLAKENGLSNETLTVQLKPLPAYIDGKSNSKFVAGQVSIIVV